MLPDADQLGQLWSAGEQLLCDHRAVDGATAAALLTGLRELIEEPLCIVI
jgi:hypothetical protein